MRRQLDIHKAFGVALKELPEEEIKNAAAEVGQVNKLLEKSSISSLKEVPTVGPLALLIMMAAMDERVHEDALNVLNRVQSAYAKRKRRSRKEKEKAEVRKCWLKWQQNPKLYPNITRFISAMLVETGINQKSTLEKWVSELKKEFA